MIAYRASDGTMHAIDSMPIYRLRPATLKLEREGDSSRAEETAAMRAELDRRDTEFQAKVALLKAEGFCAVELAGFGWVIMGPLATHVTLPTKSEDGAWFKLMELRP